MDGTIKTGGCFVDCSSDGAASLSITHADKILQSVLHEFFRNKPTQRLAYRAGVIPYYNVS
jgi:hypothetical protein